MEEAQEILLNSLENSGVNLPTAVSSIQDLNPSALVSICSQSLHLINDSFSFPTSLPDSMADQFKICTEITSAIKNLGYRGDLSFHQLLYPSEEDSFKLVRFLVERLSERSIGKKVADRKEVGARLRANKFKSAVKEVDRDYQTIRTRLEGLRLETEVPESSGTVAKEVFVNGRLEAPLIPQRDESAVADLSRSGSIESNEKEEVMNMEDVKESVEVFRDSKTDASGNGVNLAQSEDSHGAENEVSFQERSSKIRSEIEDLRIQEKMLLEEVAAKALEAQHLGDQNEVLKAAVEMAFDDQHPVDFYIEELNKRVEAGRQNLVELELQWDTFEKPLEEKKRTLEESLHAKKPVEQKKLQKEKEVELETEAILSELQKRKEEHSRLSVELKNQPIIASRKSYIQRITEITKNSRKQDADVERILQETRDLQIESNSIQDRLHRTYAVVDEIVSRDAKTDPVRRQVYKLLTSTHESFQKISEKILKTDRTQRQAAELEIKLAAMASRSLNIDKLQSDLDAIRRENEFLEQLQNKLNMQIHHS